MKKRGIAIESVTQPADTNTPGGNLQQNVHFIFSEYDNQLRREKVVAGMKEKLNQGVWITARPPGYDSVIVNGERKLVVNAQGKLIRKAFEWKSRERITNVEIQKRMNESGYFIPLQSLSKVLRNPFYCGIIIHKMVDGGIVDGKHEKIVAREVFLKVQEIISEKHHNYKHELEREAHPLRRFVKCGVCGTSFAGYEVKKKNTLL